MRKRLRDKVVKAVKKTAHNDRKKPYSEISDGCASRAVAVALMNGLHPKSDTARMTRWVLTGNDVSRFLGIERLVHPVKFDGMVLSFGGAPVVVYAWAAFRIARDQVRERVQGLDAEGPDLPGRVGPPRGAAAAPGVFAGRRRAASSGGSWRRRRSGDDGRAAGGTMLAMSYASPGAIASTAAQMELTSPALDASRVQARCSRLDQFLPHQSTATGCALPSTRRESVLCPRTSSQPRGHRRAWRRWLGERRRVIRPHLERDLITLSENASRHGHHFAQQ